MNMLSQFIKNKQVYKQKNKQGHKQQEQGLGCN